MVRSRTKLAFVMRELSKISVETLVIPHLGDYRPEAVQRWFGNVALELEAGLHSVNERAQFESYYSEAGLLRAWRRPFFRRHYAETLAEATGFLFGGTKMPTILDLGCGTGTQSLLFALHGAKVVAADMDPVALRVFRHRLNLYQELSGRTLPVTIIEGNTFNLNYKAHGPFDGVYSLFAFNMMQPSAKLVNILLPHLAVGARWAVLDGNNGGVWPRLIPSRRRHVWSPGVMRSELEKRGFSIQSQRGGIALPPAFWAVLPYRLARVLDRRMCASLFWPISCQTLAVLKRTN